MTVTNARPSPYLTLSTDADWEMLTGAEGWGDGVDLGSNSLVPSLDTVGRNIVIGAGHCQVKGKVWSTDASVSTPIPGASSQNRYDRLTMRLSRTAGDGTTFLQPNIIMGTPSGTPTIPALTQTTTGLWDLPICHWLSASSGALSGLVDERFDSGKTVHFGLAANMPTWFTRPTLYFQTDTGIMMLWNGSTWNPLAPQPGAVVNMPAMVNSWNVGGHASYRFTVNGDLQVSFKDLQPGSVSDGTNIWNAGAISPTVGNNHRVVCGSDGVKSVGGGLEVAHLEFETDGSVQCYGISSTTTRVDLYTTIPLF